MLARYKMATRDLKHATRDARLAWALARRGKLRLSPVGIRGRREVKDLFRRSEKALKPSKID
jgi:hypothetical protein